MPRSVNPGDIQVGKGRAPQGTVEDNSLRTPDRDVQPLRAHIHDPSRAHFAVSIAIEDVANNFSSDEVEGALAELASSTSAGRLNGLLTGGGFSSAGLTFTLDTPTTVLLNGTEQDFAGASVALVDNVTQFVYIDVSTATLVTSPTAPTMVSEDILLHEVTTAAGSVTGSRDGRWFVLNIDRKPALTVRSSGTAFNQASEANFISLEAALLYLEEYAGTGSDPMETHKIVVRGSHTISSTITVPVDGVIFEGDGAAEFVDATGGSTMFSVTGRDNLKFQNILFTANDPSTVALGGNDPVLGLVVENCRFEAGGDSFGSILDLSTVAVAGAARIRFQNVLASCYSGIIIGRPTNFRIVDSFLSGAGGASGSGVGIDLGASAFASQGRNQVRGCRIAGFETGISSADDYVTIEDTEIENTEFGVISTGTEPTFTNVTVTLDATDGGSGIAAAGDRAKVSLCRIVNPRTVWSGTTPVGLVLTGADGLVTGCHVEGFLDDFSFAGVGISLSGTAANSQISDCLIRSTITGIEVGTSCNSVVITNCRLEEVRFGVTSLGDQTYISNSAVDLASRDDAAGALNGIILGDGSSKAISCRVDCNRSWLAGPTGDDPSGIVITGGADGSTVEGCDITGFYNEQDDLGQAVLVSPGANSVRVSDSTLNGWIGIKVENGAARFTAADNQITGIFTGIEITSSGTDNYHLLDNCRVILGPVAGLVGILLTSCDQVQISNCTLQNPRGSYSAPELPIGIDVAGSKNISIDNCHVLGFYNPTGGIGFGIRTDADAVSILGSKILEAQRGIQINTTASGGARVVGCDLREVETAIEVGNARVAISDCNIILDTVRGLNGILGTSDSPQLRVIGCDIENPRSSWVGEASTPVGVQFEASDGHASGNTLRGFYNTDNATGQGIIVLGSVAQAVLDGNIISDSHTGIEADSCTSVVVSSNSIAGSGNPATKGIYVHGTGTGAAQVVGTTLTGNQVTGVTSHGIHVEGSVRETTITANKIDGFIGNNTEPTAVGISLETTAGNTVQYATVGENVMFGLTHGILLEAPAGEAVRRITVSDNEIHHIAVGTAPADTFVGAGSKGIGVNEGLNITITGNQLFDMGELVNADGSTFAPVAVDYSAQGIYCLNCGQMTIEGNNVRAVSIAGAGVGRALSVRLRGNIGNRTEQGFVVSNNMIFNPNDAGILVEAADSATGGIQAMNDVSVSGNTVVQPGGIAIRVSATGNATNEARIQSVALSGNSINKGNGGIRLNCDQNGKMRAVSVDGNSVFENLDAAISLDCLAADAEILGCTVANNTIEAPGSYGITANVAFGSAVMEDLVISGNAIRESVGYGIWAQASLNLSAGGAYPNLTINGNVLDNIGADAVRIDATGLALVVGASIKGNSIRGAQGDAIAVVANTAILAGCFISGNTISSPNNNGIFTRMTGLAGSITDVNLVDNNIATPGENGILISSDNANTGVFGRITIADCMVVDPTLRGIYISGEDTDLSGVQIQGCQVNGITTGGTMTHGILVETSENTSSVRHDINVASIQDCLVSNVSAGATAMVGGIVLDAAGIWSGVEIRGCVVAGANWSGGDGIRVRSNFDFVARVYCTSLLIAKNQVTLVPSAVEIIGAAPTTLTAGFRNISLLDNQVSACTQGIFVNADPFLTGSDPAVANLSIRGNTLDNIQQYGVQLGTSAPTPSNSVNQSAAWESVDISRNIFTLTNQSKSSTSPSLFCLLEVPCQNWTISRNLFRDTGGTDLVPVNGVDAVRLHVGNGGAAAGLQNFDVSYNQVWDSQGKAFEVEYMGANVGAVRNFSFCHNTMKNIILSTSETFPYAVDLDFSDSGGAELIRVSHNTIHNTINSRGIFLSTPSNDLIESWQVNYNILKDLEIDGSSAQSGILLQGNDSSLNFQGIGNNLQNIQNASGGTNATGIEFSVADTAAESSINTVWANNILDDCGGSGMLLDSARPTSRFTFHGNIAADCGSNCFSFGFGTNGTATQWTVTGNSTGISDTNSVFSSLPASTADNQVQANTGVASGTGWSALAVSLNASTANNTN